MQMNIIILIKFVLEITAIVFESEKKEKKYLTTNFTNILKEQTYF